MNRKINPNKIIIVILILSLVIIALGLKLSGIFDSDPDGVDRISEASPTESSLKIAEKIRKQKSIGRFDKIVIASDGNNSNLISAACLANAENVPLIIEEDGNFDDIQKYISEYVKKDGLIYFVGDKKTDKESLKNLEAKLSKDYKVNSIMGKDSSEINQSVLVQILKNSDGGIKELFICETQNAENAFSALATGRPIFFFDEKISKEQRDFLKGISLNNIYLIGDARTISTETELVLREYTKSCFRFDNDETPINDRSIAEYFFKGKIDRFICNPATSPAKCAIGGTLGKNLNLPVFVTGRKEFEDAHVYSNLKDIKKCVAIGSKRELRASELVRIFEEDVSITVNDEEVSEYAIDFGKDAKSNVAIYFIAHQDDETLSHFGGIIQDLRDGREVHVVLITDGSSSGACDLMIKSGLIENKAQFTESRNKEFRSALTALGVDESNIHTEGRFVDGSLKDNTKALRQYMLEWVSKYEGAAVRAHAPNLEDFSPHDDHASIGRAAVYLYNKKNISELYLFPDSYNYKHYYGIKGIRLKKLPINGLEEVEKTKLKQAVDSYFYINYAEGRYGIGSLSVPIYWKILQEEGCSYCYKYK